VISVQAIAQDIEDCQTAAQQLCNQGDSDCRWYHGSWHLLKALGVVSTADLPAQAIMVLLKQAFAGRSVARVLITGAADEALPALAWQAASESSVKVEFHALDICATPLYFMSSYARRRGIELTVHQSDILAFHSLTSFDVLLTHAFMGYFTAAARPHLVSTWRRLLAADGQLVTVQRIRPTDSAQVVNFNEYQARRFLEAALVSARQMTDINNEPGPFDANSVRLAASSFSSRFVNHAITSRQEFETLFCNAGLDFCTLEYQTLAVDSPLSGPSVPSKAEFAHVVATPA